MPDNLKLLQLQKNVWDLQILQESFRNHTKIFTSLPDILGLVENLEQCLATLGSTGVFVNTYKNILKCFWDFV